MTTIVKAYGAENVQPRKCRRGGCPCREVSVGEVSGRESIRQGTVLRRSVSLGSVHREVSVEEMSEYQ